MAFVPGPQTRHKTGTDVAALSTGRRLHWLFYSIVGHLSKKVTFSRIFDSPGVARAVLLTEISHERPIPEK